MTESASDRSEEPVPTDEELQRVLTALSVGQVDAMTRVESDAAEVGENSREVYESIASRYRSAFRSAVVVSILALIGLVALIVMLSGSH